MFAFWICVAILLAYIALRLWMTWRMTRDDEPGYDALQHETDEVAKARVREKERMIAQAHYGPLRDGRDF